MKKSIPLYVTLIFLSIAVALRVLQHVLLIDTEGFYTLQTAGDTLLRASVPILLVIFSLFALCVVLSDKEKACRCSGKGIGVTYIVLGLSLAVESGVRAAALDYVAVAAMLAAIYFCFDGVLMLRNKQAGTFIKVLSAAAPLYFCLGGVSLFFSSFTRANASGVRLEMLSLCACAYMFVTLAVAGAASSASRGRVKSGAMLAAVFALTPVITQALFLANGITALSLIAVVRNAAAGCAALAVLFRACKESGNTAE